MLKDPCLKNRIYMFLLQIKINYQRKGCSLEQMVISGVRRPCGPKVKNFEELRKSWKRLDKLGPMRKVKKKYTTWVHNLCTSVVYPADRIYEEVHKPGTQLCTSVVYQRAAKSRNTFKVHNLGTQLCTYPVWGLHLLIEYTTWVHNCVP